MACEHEVGIKIFKECDPSFELATNSKPEDLYVVFDYCPICGEGLVVCDICGILRGVDKMNRIDEDGKLSACDYCCNE